MSEASLFPVALLAGLETAVNRTLALDPATLECMRALEGKVIAMEFRLDAQATQNPTLYVLPGPAGVRLMGQFEGQPDTTLRGSPLSLLRMTMGATGEGLFTGEVEFHGDVALGQRFKRIWDDLEIDWEEHLSQYTGDILAHQAGNMVRGLGEWGREAAARLRQDLGEYLQEERRDLPHRNEVADFLAGVDRLRDDVERIDARVRRLQSAAE
jgi:ubiquinone biosynthesis protein UbiJ